jgi:hypothetical protein
MKKRNLKSLKLNKRSISNLSKIKGGEGGFFSNLFECFDPSDMTEPSICTVYDYGEGFYPIPYMCEQTCQTACYGK